MIDFASVFVVYFIRAWDGVHSRIGVCFFCYYCRVLTKLVGQAAVLERSILSFSFYVSVCMFFSLFSYFVFL